MKTFLLAGSAIFIAIILISFPQDAYEASIRGLNMWWEIVFPSLLPFFITAELLLSFGVVRFIGVLFEPIMRPLFKVPGTGSFAWIMGMASGYPTGAKISVRLRESKQLTQIEAERLVSFSNASSPLFIFGAISVGFFYDAKLGILIAVAHYCSNFLVGLCMRFYGRKAEKRGQQIMPHKKEKVTLKRALHEMHATRMEDKRPLGEILGDAVIQSIQTLVMVGGFIILFSVLTTLLYLVNITSSISLIIEQVFIYIQFPVNLALPFISGLFEITVGANLISKLTNDYFLSSIVLVSFILGFHGFSIQAQVASILSKTDIRFAPYFFARILHGFIASFLTILLYRPLYLNRQVINIGDVPVTTPVAEQNWGIIMSNLQHIGPAISFVFLGLAIFILMKRMRRA